MRLLPPRPTVRAWLVGAARRPARALVVVATLAVMTVGTVGALVAADSLDRLFVADAEAEWGAVDVEVTSVVTAVFEESLGRLLGAEAGAHSVQWAPRLILRAVTEAGDRQEPDTLVLGLGAEEQSYPALQAVAGSGDPLLLEPDEVLLNQRAARRLGAGVGDEVRLVIAIPEIEEEVPGRDTTRTREPEAVQAAFRVAGVVADAGVADLHRTPNVLLRRDVLQRVTRLEGFVTHLHMTAAGQGPDADEDLQRELEPIMRQVGVTAALVADDALTIADDEGGQFRSILLTLALLVVAAAMIATVQMLTSLAEDRSREIALLRALGTPQRTIARLVAGEGTAYAVVAVALGIAGAVPVANLLATLLADHFAALAAGRGREQVALLPVVSAATVVTGALTVLGSAWFAGRAAGRRLAAVDPGVLLRGPLVLVPEPPLSGRRPVVVGLLGSLVLGTGLTDAVAADALRYMGITLLLTAWWLHLRRLRADRRRLDERAAVVGLVWSTLGAAALADFSQGYETGFGVLVVAGIVSIAAATVLLTSRFRSVMRLLRSYAPRGRWQAALRTAGAYAEASSGRTGRLHATFGLVLFIAAALHVLGNATNIDVARQSGGFDIVAESVAEIDEQALRDVPGLRTSAALPAVTIPEDRYGVERDSDDDETEVLRVRYPVRLVGVRSAFPAVQGFGLAAALPEYASSGQLLETVQVDADKAVVDRYAWPPGAQVGDDVVLDVGSGPRRYELIGVLDTFLLGSVFVSDSELAELVSSPGPTLLLGDAAEQTSPEQLAATLREHGRDIGLDVQTVGEVAADIVAVNRTFTDTFALMLLLGLGVALVAVAAMLVRSALERRTSLAVLRAIGFPRRTVALTVAAEPISVAVVGSVAGLVIGLGVLRLLFAAGFSDLAFVVDLGRIALVLAATTTLLVVLCLLAAWPAVPRHPDEALREVG